MIKPSRIIRDYQEEAGSFSSRLNLYGFVDDHIFLTKSGDLAAVLQVPGVDYECLDPSALNDITRRFEAALRMFDEEYRIYQYILKRDSPPIPHQAYPDNPVLNEAITNRVAYMEGKSAELYTLEIYFAIVYEGARPAAANQFKNLFQRPGETISQWLSSAKTTEFLESQVDAGRAVFGNKLKSLVIQLRDTVAAELLPKAEAFQFLRRLLNFAPYKADSVRLKHDTFLDYYVCDSNLECHRGHIRLDDYFVKVLTLKEPPAQTWPNILRALYEIHSNAIIATEWQRVSNFDARKEIQSKRRHFHNSKTSMMANMGGSPPNPSEVLVDDAAQAIVGDLGSCLRELEVNGNYFGRFSMTVVLYAHKHQAVDTAVAEAFKVFSTYDGVLLEERYNVLNAFLAIVPGNWAYNLRYMYLLNTNYADISFLFTLSTGERENKHLGAEYLAVLETNHGTPYFLNLHYQDRAHTIVLGATGAGKSFFLNFLLTNLQKYNPHTFIFDLGGSYEATTENFQGSYMRVGVEHRAFQINPFCLEPTKENLHFLFSFVKVLIESGDGGARLSNTEQKDLYDQISNLYEIDRENRRLSTLANIMPRHIAQHLARWIQGGAYAALFDNVEDTLSFARFQAFDFEGLDKYPQILEPLLFYVLHRANASIYAPELATTFKTFVMDEAWRFLENETIKQYITEALKTWRKRNAALIMATQSSDDLSRSDILRIIVESCATTIFLANPGMDQAVYRDIFHLNETESALVAELVPKKQALIKRPDMARVVNLNVDDTSYWLYTNNPFDNQRKREAIKKHGLKKGLEILAASRKA